VVYASQTYTNYLDVI